uniref:Uncharacterized protein n=1 Tax=Solanum tuberosum TaxID=4113 RepID=M0ZNZ0_SOLTU
MADAPASAVRHDNGIIHQHLRHSVCGSILYRNRHSVCGSRNNSLPQLQSQSTCGQSVASWLS